MRFIIYPYKMGSKSSKSLKESLINLGHRVVRVWPDGNYRPRRDDIIVNWGNNSLPTWAAMASDVGARFLNKVESVRAATNKLLCLQTLKDAELPVIPFTTSKEEASQWSKVYLRRLLRSHSGNGIHIMSGEELANSNERAALYTKGISSRGEYRVHVFRGEVIDYRKKRRVNGNYATPEQEDIRTHANGWIYSFENLRRIERVEQLAIKAVATLGLDFGAVDIIMDRERNPLVLEVNTAVGLEGKTLESYEDALSGFANEE